MKKQSKISYKVYLNTRLQPVFFHGAKTAPLYVQVIYNKKPIYFKSCYFDQLTHPKYAIQSILGNKAPIITQVIRWEEELLGHLCEKYADKFEIDVFKRDYYHLGRDLLFAMDEGFKQYMVTFFQDDGLPVLASLINEGGKYTTGEHILYDFKKSVDEKVFNKLLENAVFYAPPYIPLCAFFRANPEKDVPFLSVLNWSSVGIKDNFKSFINSQYPEYNFDQVDQYLDKLIESFQ